MKKKSQAAKDIEKLESEQVTTPAPEIVPQIDVIHFQIGEIVYHKVDEQNCRGQVLGVMVQPGHYKYLVRWAGMEDLFHFDFELSKTPCGPTPEEEEEEA